MFTEVFAMIYVPFADFLTVVTLLYLFYFQGMHSKKKKKNFSSVSGVNNLDKNNRGANIFGKLPIAGGEIIDDSDNHS